MPSMLASCTFPEMHIAWQSVPLMILNYRFHCCSMQCSKMLAYQWYSEERELENSCGENQTIEVHILYWLYLGLIWQGLATCLHCLPTNAHHGPHCPGKWSGKWPVSVYWGLLSEHFRMPRGRGRGTHRRWGTRACILITSWWHWPLLVHTGCVGCSEWRGTDWLSCRVFLMSAFGPGRHEWLLCRLEL